MKLLLENNYKVFNINGIHEKLRVMLISGEPNMGLRNYVIFLMQIHLFNYYTLQS